MNKTIITAAAIIVASPLVSLATAHAAGTTNTRASCVAQANTTLGSPGSSVQTIKLYVSPVPGQLFSTIATSDHSHCELPS